MIFAMVRVVLHFGFIDINWNIHLYLFSWHIIRCFECRTIHCSFGICQSRVKFLHFLLVACNEFKILQIELNAFIVVAWYNEIVETKSDSGGCCNLLSTSAANIYPS